MAETIAGDELIDACRPETPVIDAELVIDCGNDEIVVRVSNSGAVDGNARVVINGDASEIAVPAGDVVVVRGDLPVNGAYLVDVSVGRGEHVDRTGHGDRVPVASRRGTACVGVVLVPLGRGRRAGREPLRRASVR